MLIRSISIALVAIVTLMAPMSPAVMSAQDPTPGSIFGDDIDASCASGRLLLADLNVADESIESGVAHVVEKGMAWQQDARLYTLRLGCPLLTTGMQWEGIFFSETAQAFYATDTGRVDAVNDDPDTIPELDVEGISLSTVYRTLIRAGFTDDLLLRAAGGVTIRLSTDTHPFGPDSAPKGQVYAHVAVEVSGQVTDVWVSMVDGTIYRY